MMLTSVVGLERYMVDANGDVYDTWQSNQKLNPVITEPYVCFVLLDANNIKRLRTRHRLIATAFIPCHGDASTMVVNHLNGIPGDDRLENLEWVTYRENSEHAGMMGLTSKCLPLLVRDSDTGQIEEWPSLISYAIETGMTKDAIAYRVQIGPERIFPERKQYKTSFDLRDWLIPKSVDDALCSNGNAQAVYVRNCLTREVVFWPNSTVVAEAFNVSLPAINKWLNLPNQPVLPPYMIQIKRAQDESPWRIVADPWLEVDQFSGSRVIVLEDVLLHAVDFSIGMASVCERLGIKKTTLLYRLKQPGSIWDGRYRVSYYFDYQVRLSCEGQLCIP